MQYLVLIGMILDLFGKYIVFIKEVLLVECVNCSKVMLLLMVIGKLYLGCIIIFLMLNFCLDFLVFFLLRFFSVMLYMLGLLEFEMQWVVVIIYVGVISELLQENFEFLVLSFVCQGYLFGVVFVLLIIWLIVVDDLLYVVVMCLNICRIMKENIWEILL